MPIKVLKCKLKFFLLHEHGGPTFSCPWYQLELTAVHWLWLWLWMWLVHRICEQTVWTVWGGNIALKSELWWEMDIGHLPTISNVWLLPWPSKTGWGDDIDYCCPRAVKGGAMHCHFLCLCLCICSLNNFSLSFFCICLCHYLFVGQVMCPHHSDQMSQRSQVSRVTL